MAADKSVADVDDAAALVGRVLRYEVTQPSGRVVTQLVLVVSGPDDDGAVRGVPLCYEHEAAAFYPHQFATG